MNLRGKIPVESLDEIRIARIERAAILDYQNLGVEPPQARPSMWVPALAAAACMAAAFFAWQHFQGSETASTKYAAAHPVSLEAGDDAATFVVGDAQVRLAAHSRASVQTDPNGGVRVDLAHGEVLCTVEPRNKRPPFEVFAEDVRVTVVGTEFSVRNLDGVAVSVVHGKVRVERAGQVAMLTAGQIWGDQKVATRVRPAGVNPENGLPGEAQIKTEPVAPVHPPVKPETTKKRDHKAAAGSANNLTTGSAKRPTPNKPAPQASFSYVRPVPGMDPILDISETDTARAIRAYRRLSIGRGDKAGAALYSMAYLELYRNRNARGALAAAERYESRFRSGSNAESLIWIRIAALCKQGLGSKCRAAAHSYSRRFPGGRFADEVAGIINQTR